MGTDTVNLFWHQMLLIDGIGILIALLWLAWITRGGDSKK